MKTIFLKGISSLGLAIPLIYEIFIAIDAIIYAIAGYAMQTFFAIARLELTDATLNSFTYITNRVMLLCGIYALFRLAITMINYIVDPSKIDALGKNGTKVAKNIIIAAVLLASSSMIFTSLFKFQTRVINTNVIPKIIYGSENYTEEDEGDMELTSKKFVNSVFMTLFLKGNDASGLDGNAGNAVSRVLQGDSINVVAPYAYSDGFQYIPILTGLVGILLCYYFIKFAIELGVRLIKLFILQVISPIPIIMSVDPSQKGDKIKNFIKLYGGIYLSVFIRVLTVYLAFATLSLISEVFDSKNFIETTGNISWLVKILLIIAVFHAVKEIPKLIEDALGTKLGLGDTGKGFGSLIKGTLAGGAGLVGGAIAGGISGGAGGALAGAFTGLTSGVTKGAAAKNAVGVLSAGTNAVKGGFGTGARVAGAGGLGMFALGGVENFIGGKGKDSATLTKFDNDMKVKDKEIEKVNNMINASNRGNDIRNEIENTLTRRYESTHGTLSDALENNTEIQNIKDKIANAQTEDERNQAMSELATKRNEITSNYNAQKDQYFESNLQVASGNVIGPLTPEQVELSQMINDYNKYLDDNGFSDRKITDLASLNHSKQKYEQADENYKNQLKKYEQDKKDIERQKKEFEGSSGYKRRNKRDTKPEYKARNTNGNGAGTP